MLDVINLKKSFTHKDELVTAVDGVNFFVKEHKTTAVVGESGCGKTTLAKTILGFYKPDEGKIQYKGNVITEPRNHKLIREHIQIVFQNPFLSFDPRYTIFATLHEAFKMRPSAKKQDAKECIVARLNDVGLNEEYLFQYPHQLSGGELQRVSLARALIRQAQLIILDEPTSSLDVSTTVRIIDLLRRLQDEFGLSYLFISHNIKLVRKISHFVFVMYYGKVLESAPTALLYKNPVHPYTRLLLEAADYKFKKAAAAFKKNDSACIFYDRCPRGDKLCKEIPLRKEIEPGHFVFCHHASL